MFYLAGYLSKNPVKPTHWVTCITAARKSALKYGSTAEDAGTPNRNVIFLLQKILNRLNALAEVSDTQGSMLLLGEPSWVCSHPFHFCFAKAAVEYQIERCMTVVVSGTDDQVSESEQVSAELSAELEQSQFSDIFTKFDHVSNSSLVEDTGSSQTNTPVHPNSTSGGAVLYTDHEGTVHVISQHYHYRHRVQDWDCRIDGVVPDMLWWYRHARGVNHPGWRRWDQRCGLSMLSLTQYVIHIQLIPMPKGELRVGMYPFNEEHPLHLSHVQKLVSRDRVPTLSGKPPTRPSGACPPEGDPRRIT